MKNSYAGSADSDSRPVTDYPKLALFLLAVGSFSFARFAFKTLLVLFQTFIVSGKSVRCEISVCKGLR